MPGRKRRKRTRRRKFSFVLNKSCDERTRSSVLWYIEGLVCSSCISSRTNQSFGFRLCHGTWTGYKFPTIWSISAILSKSKVLHYGFIRLVNFMLKRPASWHLALEPRVWWLQIPERIWLYRLAGRKTQRHDLATAIGFCDPNPIDGKQSLNPAGTVFVTVHLFSAKWQTKVAWMSGGMRKKFQMTPRTIPSLYDNDQ